MKKIIYYFLLLLFAIPTISKSQISLKPGDKAVEFTLKNINDKNVSLSNFDSEKGVILIFTCNHCPFSVAYEDRIIAIHAKYSKRGFPVVAINPNDALQYPEDDFLNMKKRAKEKNFPFVYLYDSLQVVAKAYGAIRTPHVYLLQKEGTDYIVKYVGAIDDNSDEPASVTKKYLENAIDALLEGKPIAENFTKAIGCSIKWKK